MLPSIPLFHILPHLIIFILFLSLQQNKRFSSSCGKEVMYFFYVLIYLKFTPLKTWFLNFSFHQYSLFYLYFMKTKAFGNLSKKMCWGGLDWVIFDTFFWQATGSLRYTTGCLCTQQGAYVHNRKRAHSYTMELIGT